jgi:hypothetical protein
MAALAAMAFVARRTDAWGLAVCEAASLPVDGGQKFPGTKRRNRRRNNVRGKQRAAGNGQQTTDNGQRKEFGKTRGPCLSTRLARFPPTEPGNSNRGAAVTLQWWIDASIHRRREDGDIR